MSIRIRSTRSMLLAIGPALSVLLLCLILAYLIGHGYLAIDLGLIHLDPSILVCTGLVLSVLLFTFASLAVTAVNDSRAQLLRQGQPVPAVSGILTRMVQHGTSGGEFLISGSGDQTPRDLLQGKWPFDANDRKKAWYIIDENENDVTDVPLSECKGSLSLRFD